VLSIIGASIFLDEPITSLQVPGIGIVLTAFVLTIRHNARVRELTEVQP
jgi:drug/metabolite transporter (DMT)-like permease